MQIKSQISAIHHLPSPATPLLLISSSSQFYLLDSKLQSHSISTASLKSSELLASRVILQETKQSVRVIVVDRTGRIEVTKIWIEDRRLERILEGKVGNGKLVAGDVSDDGVITVLGTSFINNIKASFTDCQHFKMNNIISTPPLLELSQHPLPLFVSFTLPPRLFFSLSLHLPFPSSFFPLPIHPLPFFSPFLLPTCPQSSPLPRFLHSPLLAQFLLYLSFPFALGCTQSVSSSLINTVKEKGLAVGVCFTHVK